jgi:hypothetical protein
MSVRDVFHYTMDIKGRTCSNFIYVLLLALDTKFHVHTDKYKIPYQYQPRPQYRHWMVRLVTAKEDPPFVTWLVIVTCTLLIAQF